MAKNFQMWIRGHLYEIEGFIESADRDVGIMGDGFCPESFTDVESGVILSFDDMVLTDGEQVDIDAAYWASLDAPVRESFWYERIGETEDDSGFWMVLS